RLESVSSSTTLEDRALNHPQTRSTPLVSWKVTKARAEPEPEMRGVLASLLSSRYP
ncbi:hypothetical protein OF83DRAFT_1159403, partial [Amylostereum chailletii]